MSKHTPEPWPHFIDCCEPSTPHPESDGVVRLGFDDYDRARACVNACADISTEVLEVHTGPRLLHTRLEESFSRIDTLLGERNATGLAIDAAIRTGVVPEQHPLRSRLEMLANHRKREQDLSAQLTDATRHVAALEPQANAAHLAGHALGLMAGSDVTTELMPAIKAAVSSANAWKSLHKWVNDERNNPQMEIMHSVSVELHKDGCFSAWIHLSRFIEALFDRISDLEEDDAALAGNVPDHIADANKMVVPEGWQLVPVEPTVEMWRAVNKLDDEMAAGGYDGKGASIEQCWDCLLAAAPKPEGGAS
jgi:hypothetical protein